MTVGLLAQAGNASAAAILASLLLWGSVLFAVGVWLSLPGGGYIRRTVGQITAIAALGVFAWQLPPLFGWLDRGLFAVLAVVTVLSCLAAVTARNPVYCAIWFGLALLGTAGLFLLLGAQFLSVATVTVYAGAILVTFLFVIMLAQPRGHAYYDRVSWEAFLSAAAGAVLVGLLTAAIQRGTETPDGVAATVAVVSLASRTDAATHGVLSDEHVAHLGRELVGRHLISMQAAGVLMLAALVGAMAIIAYGRQSQAASVELAERALLRTNDAPAIVLPQPQQSSVRRESPGGIHA